MNRGGSIAGFVVDRTGKPVKNALIKLRENQTKDNPVHQLFGQLAGMGKEAQTRSGEDGSFRIDLIVPDTYQVYVRHNKYAALSIDDVTVEKSRVRDMGKIEVRRGGKVSGHAYDLDGQPLIGATILAVSKTSDTHQARSNNEGYYEIDQLPNGEYTITINSYQSNPPINTLRALVLAKNSKQSANIIDGDELNIDLRLKDNTK